ncbi:MAG: STAS domain-containing protein [Planctomycetes bacterium]|nr:STAS domain-containing protein [Planctomycetota bacterium]
MKPLEINTEKAEGVTFVTVSGYITASERDDLDTALESLTDEHEKFIIVDLKDLELITSDGLGVLIRAHKAAVEYGGRFVLCGLKGNVLDVFRMTALDKVLQLYDSVDAAVNSAPA